MKKTNALRTTPEATARVISGAIRQRAEAFVSSVMRLLLRPGEAEG